MFQRDWVSLGFLRTIARSKQICTALCAPSWLLLLFNIISGQNVGYPATITMQVCISIEKINSAVFLKGFFSNLNHILQLQALRLLQTILPVGLSDANSYPIVIKKLFHLLGSIGMLCYPDLALYNFGKC